MPDHPIRDDIRLLDGYWYQQQPLEHYRWMRENAPVYWDPVGEIWGVTLHEDVQLVSRTPQVYCSGKSSRPERDTWIPSMINLDDPDHKRRRNLVNRGFTKRRVDDHEPKIRRIVGELIDRVIERGECEFVHEVAAPLPMIVIGDMLGVAPEDRDKLLQWSDDLVTGIGIDDPAIRDRQIQASLAYFDYAKKVFADRKADPTDDLMSVLCHSEIDGEKLSEEEILQESLLILVGGDETTRHVMTEGTEALIRNPAERQKLVDDPSRITVAVEEMLRWVSPIKNMNRTAGFRISASVPSVMTWRGQSRRARVRRARTLRRRAQPERARGLRRLRHPLLPGCQPRPPRAARLLRGAPRASPRAGARERRPAPHAREQLHRRHRRDAGALVGARARRPA